MLWLLTLIPVFMLLQPKVPQILLEWFRMFTFKYSESSPHTWRNGWVSPWCLSNIGLYGKEFLELLLTSLTEYKCFKCRLQMTLKDSKDQTINKAVPRLQTGRKWTSSKAVQQATSALRHRDIVGNIQHGRGEFGLAASKPTFHKAPTSECRKLVVQCKGCLSC